MYHQSTERNPRTGSGEHSSKLDNRGQDDWEVKKAMEISLTMPQSRLFLHLNWLYDHTQSERDSSLIRTKTLLIRKYFLNVCFVMHCCTARCTPYNFRWTLYFLNVPLKITSANNVHLENAFLMYVWQRTTCEQTVNRTFVHVDTKLTECLLKGATDITIKARTTKLMLILHSTGSFYSHYKKPYSAIVQDPPPPSQCMYILFFLYLRYEEKLVYPRLGYFSVLVCRKHNYRSKQSIATNALLLYK